jgi:hypothetical protein
MCKRMNVKRQLFSLEEEAAHCPLEIPPSDFIFLYQEEAAHCPFLHSSS